jgi:hypothetical protein
MKKYLVALFSALILVIGCSENSSTGSDNKSDDSILYMSFQSDTVSYSSYYYPNNFSFNSGHDSTHIYMEFDSTASIDDLESLRNGLVEFIFIFPHTITLPDSSKPSQELFRSVADPLSEADCCTQTPILDSLVNGKLYGTVTGKTTLVQKHKPCLIDGDMLFICYDKLDTPIEYKLHFIFDLNIRETD